MHRTNLAFVAGAVLLFLVVGGATYALSTHGIGGSASVVIQPAPVTRQPLTVAPVSFTAWAPHEPRVLVAIPVTLNIPSIGLTDSHIANVGLLRGAIATSCDPMTPYAPCDAFSTAWYNGSVRPGEPGNAIIGGHVDWYKQVNGVTQPKGDEPAAFAHLASIKVGDLVYVTDTLRRVRTFRVDSISNLPYPAEPDGFLSTTGTPSITLVTCAGRYVSKSVGDASRLYAHATLIA